MKKNAIKILLMSLCALQVGVITSCTNNTETKEEIDAHEELSVDKMEDVTYACPMHPEITGEMGEDCSKCGMPLEPIDTQGK